MNDKQTFILAHRTARQSAMRAVSYAPAGMVVEVRPQKRSLDQNAMLHAIFAEVAKKAKFHNRALTPTQWKTLFISGHAEATGTRADVIPGIEGEFVNIRESSASMSVARMSSLIEYMLAWCADQGIDIESRAAQGFEELARQYA